MVGDPIPVGAQPASIAVGPDSVWTADFGDSTVTELRPWTGSRSDPNTAQIACSEARSGSESRC